MTICPHGLTHSQLAKNHIHRYFRHVVQKTHIVVVDDEPDISALIRFNLEKEGYAVSVLQSGDQVLPFLIKQKPSLVILDLMLPGINGLDLCRAIKSDTDLRGMPVILLTAKSQEADIVKGFEMGADDYVTKPFSVKILIMRVQSALRKRQDASEKKSDPKTDIVDIHDIHIDLGRRLVQVSGKPIELTHTEFQILYLLAKNPGWVYSRYQIVDAIRGENYAVTERSVDVQIVGLRKKLGASGACIETVRGVGYRMKGS